MSKEQLSDRYSPKEVESRIYKEWEENGCFKADLSGSKKPPYSIILPPPNVTGSLHIGHALNHTIQDVCVRWKRMTGYNVLWQPGTDHAGIATQAVVEKQLAIENTTRHEIGREAFVKKVWEWKELYGGRIVKQMKRLGDSCDWERETFTLDKSVSQAVNKVFVDLYNKKQIYKGKRLVNWSPKLESAISDLEVESKDVKGSMWHIKYPLTDGSGFIIVATTRPETILGDTAVAVHPEDERYKSYIGKELTVPFVKRTIKVISDSYVDKDFGSGAVKITPAHDFNDYEMGKRHNLEIINILNPDGTLNENTGSYQGLKVQEARKQLVKNLEEVGLLEKVEPHKLTVGHCSRSGCVIEPYLSEQWFLDTSKIKVAATRVVESGTIKFEPASFTKTYLHWMGKLEDWCISRQLWWGHRIPAWTCQDCQNLMVSESEVIKCESCGSTSLSQDEDVLDTWFSSALWPFSTLGWPNEDQKALETFYPTTLLVTGHDIIFFWIARMVMMGLEFTKDVPFRNVYIHGLVRDSNGVKMSKSIGNVVDPIEVIEQSGADALRFSLLSQVSSGRDLKFSQQRLDGYRNFMNKIWNATRFALSVVDDKVNFQTMAQPTQSNLSDADQWIIHKLAICEKEVEENLNKMRFADASRHIYHFVWNEFCDWYLELIKPIIYGDKESEKLATQYIMMHVLNRFVRLLHPFVPFITEEIYQKLPIKNSKFVMLDQYPTIENDKEFLSLGSEECAQELDLIIGVIAAIRNIRGENRIKPGQKIKAYIDPLSDKAQKILGENKVSIINLANLSDCHIQTVESKNKCAVVKVVESQWQVDVIIPLEGLVDFSVEIKRISKNIEKLNKEVLSLSKKLENKKFLENAPAEVVTEGKQQLKTFKILKSSLQESLDRFTD